MLPTVPIYHYSEYLEEWLARFGDVDSVEQEQTGNRGRETYNYTLHRMTEGEFYTTAAEYGNLSEEVDSLLEQVTSGDTHERLSQLFHQMAPLEAKLLAQLRNFRLSGWEFLHCSRKRVDSTMIAQQQFDQTKKGKQYGVIIADPPWQYNNTGTEGAAERQYSTMRLEDICALPVSPLASPHSTLLLWATWPLLPEALRVVSAWEFEYVTGFPWIKIHGVPRTNLWGELEIRPRYGVGFWARGCSELLLVGRRGKARAPTGDFMGLLSENYAHSRKPDNLYEYAESMPGPYLELFARRQRNGWDSWGAQVESTIEVDPHIPQRNDSPRSQKD